MRALLYPGMDLRPALKDFARPVLVIAGRHCLGALDEGVDTGQDFGRF